MAFNKILLRTTLLILVVQFAVIVHAQSFNNIGNRFKGMSSGGKGGNDSLKHRDPNADSLTIFYRYFDSTRTRLIDSSISDFYTRFPVPNSYIDLGNLGTAAKPLLFNPFLKPGWDAGFHAYDIYRFSVERTRFYTTTRPYSELAYVLGNKGEQTINILHTQNRSSNLNFAFEYRLVNSPGGLKNQNTSHINLRINVGYQSTNKRYGLNFIYITNKDKVSDNGGIVRDSKLDSLSLNDPFELTTRLGALNSSYRNPFNTTVTTGTSYAETILFLRHNYDFGQKDSTVTDSVTYKLFYPRLRLQHTLKYITNRYEFHDYNLQDSDYYNYFHYGGDTLIGDSLVFRDRWTDFTNEFSIITYPQKNNQSQFLKLSAGLQILKGKFYNYQDTIATNTSQSFNNIYASAEYRNRTRNQKWDLEAAGQFYLTGSYAANYSAYISLSRQLSKTLGSLQVGFQNVNRKPSFINEPISAFPSLPSNNFNNENITRIFAAIDIPPQNLRLTGNYYALTNYTYFDSFLTSKQSSLFNVLQVGLEKKIKLGKYFNFYTEVYLQKTAGNAPINIPLIYTRNRIAFEGNFFKNLFLSTGIEARYYSPYKPDNYSPLIGQFFYQDTYRVSNRPDINYFFNFRIKSFKGFLRFENLNTLNVANGFGFNKYNFTAQHYPSEGLWLRFGIWWSFVN